MKSIILKSILFLFLPILSFSNTPTFENSLQITAKAYTKEESQLNLSRNLPAQGYQPIEITIHNHTQKNYSISQSSLQIPTVDPKNIVHHLHCMHIPKSIAFKVAGFFFWPLMIPGTIDSIVTLKTHLNLKRDYFAKSIKPEVENLIPYSTVHRIIFVKKENLEETFTLYLKEEKTQIFHPFEVKINS